ncbi:DUF1642 domain-containing protein [Paenibacillus sp. JDR-2]|uniref:DUF1642 domain-containing protein n=1 Tax=Paenibacillus sp. (strain JDR-2) TaxID=324057 RepID=UPI000166A5E0|nr:DUF1642 domain-containing protein [Paenibacillus sp. JDR-2]ACT00260.1 hypothetical protein Pjdr2_1590 [Paenibacillus sp. JDR-2]
MSKLTSEKLKNITLFAGRYVEVRWLLEHIKALDLELKIAKEDEERAVSAADRLTENVAQLHMEKQELQNLVNALRAPVVLPKEVAEALEHCKDRYTPEQLAYYAVQSPTYPYGSKTPELCTLRDHANKFHTLDLVNAIQFGYTVEEPVDHKERLRVDIERLVTTWDRTLPKSTLVRDIDERLNDYFQEIAK